MKRKLIVVLVVMLLVGLGLYAYATVVSVSARPPAGYLPQQYPGLLQKVVALTDTTETDLVAAVSDKTIKVMEMIITTDTTTSFLLESSTTNEIITVYVGANGGCVLTGPGGLLPIFSTNSGEALSVTAGSASFNGRVFLLYTVE